MMWVIKRKSIVFVSLFLTTQHCYATHPTEAFLPNAGGDCPADGLVRGWGQYSSSLTNHDSANACTQNYMQDGCTGADPYPPAGGYEGDWGCVCCKTVPGYFTSDNTVPTACPAGSFQPLYQSTFCYECASGKYSSSTAQSYEATCQFCYAGKYSTSGSSACTDCTAGKFSSDQGSSVCSDCDAGKYSSGGSSYCASCQAGKYSTNSGSSACTDCTAGKFSSNQGSSVCSDCDAGKYSSGGSSYCALCQAGKYSTHSGSSACTDCTAGKFSSDQGSSVCSDCDAGKYSLLGGADVCSECDAGKFQSLNGQTSCDVCTEGKYSDTGAVYCSVCSTGKYSLQNASACNDCDAGKYQSAEEATSCDVCTEGKYSEAGASICSVCSAGKYSSSDGATVCLECDAGKYASTELATSCDVCTEGKYSDTGASICSVCSAGKYSSSDGATVCLECDAGKYASDEAATSCDACTEGKFSYAGASICFDECDAGKYQSETQESSCLDCAAGKYSASGQSSCNSCDPGTFSLNAASTCSDCDAGTFQIDSEQSSCNSCEAGTFALNGASVCLDCPAGTFQVNSEQSTCNLCEAGKFALEGASSCNDCLEGTFATGLGNTHCTNCPVGQSTDSNRSVSITACKLPDTVYSASATKFGQDCSVECKNNAHAIPYNYTVVMPYRSWVLEKYGQSTFILEALDSLQGSYEGYLLTQEVNLTWKGKQCIYCPPLQDVHDNTTISMDAYLMDATCHPTCNNEMQYYNLNNYPDTCVLCDLAMCADGEFLTANRCQECQACIPKTQHYWQFTGHGTVLNDSTSCPGNCADGYYEDMIYNLSTSALQPICIQHQELDCAEGEYLIQGTSISDAFCDACGDCEGMNMTQACSNNSNAVCEFCTPAVLETGAYYAYNNCTRLCMSGFIEDQRIQQCEECLHVCEAGTYFAATRQYCEDCTACNVTKPENTIFVRECEWSCDEGYYLEGLECRSLLQNLIPDTTTTSYSSVLCEVGQQLKCDTQSTQTAECTCISCNDITDVPHPAVDKLHVSWQWLPTRSQCTWECLPEYYLVPLSARVVDCYPWDWFQAQLGLEGTVVKHTDNIPTLRRQKIDVIIPISELVLFLLTAVTTISFFICVQK